MSRGVTSRSVPVLAALAVVLPLAACSGSDAGAGGDPDQMGDSLAVFGPSSYDTFAAGASEDTVKQVTDEVDSAFQTAFPVVTTITHDSRGTTSDGLSRLRNTTLAGTPVDVIMCAANPLNQSYVSANLVTPIDDIANKVKGDLNDGALDSFTVGGKIYGIPVSSVDTRTFYFNKDLFARLGIEAPKTYSELVAAGKKLSAEDIQPVVAQGRNVRSWAAYYMAALAQTTDNEQLKKTASNLKGETKFTDGPDVAAFAKVKGFLDDDLLSLGAIDYDAEGMRAAFIGGRAGMYFAGSSDLSILEKNVTNFEIGTFVFPHFDDQPGKAVPFGGTSNGLCLSARATNPAAAKAYIEFASTPDMATKILTPVVTFASSHKAVPGGDSPVDVALREQAKDNQKYLDWIWPSSVTAKINDQMQQMMVDTVTPEQAAAAVQAELDKLRDEGYTYSGDSE